MPPKSSGEHIPYFLEYSPGLEMKRVNLPIQIEKSF